jgi:hypothetical protein
MGVCIRDAFAQQMNSGTHAVLLTLLYDTFCFQTGLGMKLGGQADVTADTNGNLYIAVSAKASGKMVCGSSKWFSSNTQV